MMPSWFRLLLSTPPARTPLARYTAWNGALYLVLGATFYAWPGSAQTLLGAPVFQGTEAGLLRALGVTLAIIGYFYVFGARAGEDRFGVATILDRLLVPVVLAPLIATGQVAPQIGLPFAILDPLLALGAWIVFARSERGAVPAASR